MSSYVVKPPSGIIPAESEKEVRERCENGRGTRNARKGVWSVLVLFIPFSVRRKARSS